MRVAVISILLAATAGACGTDDSSDSAEARGYVVDHLAARADSASRIMLYKTVDELLPNVSFRVDGRPPRSLVDAVVVGKVADVQPGRGFVVEGVDAPGGRPVGFGDPKALWRTVHLTVAVQERIGAGQPLDTVTVSLAFDGGADVDAMRQGLQQLGTVLLFLERSSPVFAYDPTLFSIVEDGGLLATVDSNGQIDLPLKEDAEASRLLAGIATVSELKRKVSAEPRLIDVTLDAGIPTR